MTNKAERAHQEMLVAALEDYADACARAENRVLAKLRRAGWNFQSIGDAKRLKGRIDEANRARADLILATAEITSGGRR